MGQRLETSPKFPAHNSPENRAPYLSRWSFFMDEVNLVPVFAVSRFSKTENNLFLASEEAEAAIAAWVEELELKRDRVERGEIMFISPHSYPGPIYHFLPGDLKFSLFRDAPGADRISWGYLPTARPQPS